jgi:hypothetical protein
VGPCSILHQSSQWAKSSLDGIRTGQNVMLQAQAHPDSFSLGGFVIASRVVECQVFTNFKQ